MLLPQPPSSFQFLIKENSNALQMRWNGLTCRLWSTSRSIPSPSGWSETPPDPAAPETTASAAGVRGKIKGKQKTKEGKQIGMCERVKLPVNQTISPEKEPKVWSCTWTSSSSFLPSRRWIWHTRPSVIYKGSAKKFFKSTEIVSIK